MTFEEKRTIANQFIGSGNPNGKVWFVGIEEAGNEWTEENLDPFKGKSYVEALDLSESNYTQTYGGYRKTLEMVFTDFHYKGNIFATNLFPFPKEKEANDYKPDIKKLFGFKETDGKTAIQNMIKEERFFYLKKFFEKYDWQDKVIFFCFRAEFKKRLIEFMELLTSEVKFTFDEKTNDRVWIHEKYNKIYWTYHASGSFISDNDREFIKKRIEETGITL